MRVLAGVLAFLAVSCDAPPDVTASPQGQSAPTQEVAASDQPVASEETREGRIWKGTIGDLPITACFHEGESEEGVYYYNKHLSPIRLAVTDESAPNSLTEIEGYYDETGAAWAIDRKTQDHFEGTWRQGDKELPVTLSSAVVPVADYLDDCASSAFIEPLLQGGSIKRSRATFGNIEYTRLEYTGPARAGLDDYFVATLAIDVTQEGDQAINKQLADTLPKGSADDPMGKCVGLSMWNGQVGYSGASAEPTLISADWLGLRSGGSSYCGGAHPGHYVGLSVYNRQRGEEVDPSTWFKGGTLKFYEFESEYAESANRPVRALSEALLAQVIGFWPTDPSFSDDERDCANPEYLNMGWVMGLSGEGVIFVHQFPHVVFACTAEVIVPWDNLEPFLSEEGLKVRASLQ